MDDRTKLLQALAEEGVTLLEQAVALLWLYRVKQQYDERTSHELIQDFIEEGFSRPNGTRLRDQLRKDRRTIKGVRPDSYRVNPRFFSELTGKYAPFVNYTQTKDSSSIIPLGFVRGTRIYIEQMVRQINGCYDLGFYDAVAVILRRLLESLIIETYIHIKQATKIKNGTVFKSLDNLITTITNDPNVNLSRNAGKNMGLIKDIGDTAAHDRTYITPREDIDDNLLKIRRIINEMLYLAGIRK